jgi:hypothetical protein
MIVFCVVWHLMLLVFAFMPTQATGILALLLVGCAQSLGMTPMQALLLRNSHERYRTPRPMPSKPLRHGSCIDAASRGACTARQRRARGVEIHPKCGDVP